MSSGGGLRIFDYLNKDAYVIFTSVFCAVAILANLFIMVTILMSPALRTSSKHILIFALCLSDLYMGVFSMPLLAQFYALERWIHSATLLKALDMSSYFTMLSVRIMLVIGICWDCILSMLTRNKTALILLSISMIIGSVGYSVVLVLPITETQILSAQDNCLFSYQTFLSVASFFPQAVVMVVLMVDICIMSCCLSRSHSESTEQEPRRFPADVVVACVVMLVYIIPFRVVHGYFSSCSGAEACRIMHIVRGVTIQWEYVRPCVLPFVWLLCQKTRQAVKQVCCCGRNELPDNHAGQIHYPQKHEMPGVKQSSRL